MRNARVNAPALHANAAHGRHVRVRFACARARRCIDTPACMHAHLCASGHAPLAADPRPTCTGVRLGIHVCLPACMHAYPCVCAVLNGCPRTAPGRPCGCAEQTAAVDSASSAASTSAVGALHGTAPRALPEPPRPVSTIAAVQHSLLRCATVPLRPPVRSKVAAGRGCVAPDTAISVGVAVQCHWPLHAPTFLHERHAFALDALVWLRPAGARVCLFGVGLYVRLHYWCVLLHPTIHTHLLHVTCHHNSPAWIPAMQL